MRPIDALSTEPILLGPISHRVAGVETDPTGYVVEAAFSAVASAPVDWVAASWETVTTNSGTPSWWVRIFVGPLSDLGALTAGNHRARVRITVSGSELPVLDAGVVTVV